MDRKITRVRFSNNVDLDTPISLEEFQKIPHGDLMAKIDEVLYEYFHKNCWGTVSPIYEDET